MQIIDEAVRFVPQHFYPNPVTPRRHPEFAFYGGGFNQHVALACERVFQLPLDVDANEVAGIAIGFCDEHAQRIRDFARHARPAVEKLARDFPSANRKWSFRPEGAREIYAFPVLFISHGIIEVETVVLWETGRALVVQASVQQLCGPNVPRRIATPLCSDAARTLTDIALRARRLR